MFYKGASYLDALITSIEEEGMKKFTPRVRGTERVTLTRQVLIGLKNDMDQS